MPWSHHSHSGQFCGHAVDTLDDVVQNAVSKKMTVLCLTEHIHRERIDFYPREEDDHTEASLEQLYDDFYHEAHRLRKAYADRIKIFIGFEGEWIRPNSLNIVQNLLNKYPVDLFLGSVHHVHTIPIDYDKALYHKARDIAGGSDERIFGDYFDSQYELVKALKPPIAAHFDLIRLMSDEPNRSFQTWPAIWDKILRNLKFIAEYGGVLELNSSSLRKGMNEAYPQVEICQVFNEIGGRFTLSDDSHGTSHVGLNYQKVLDCVERAGIRHMYYLTAIDSSAVPHDSRFPEVCWKPLTVSELKTHTFWKRLVQA